MPSPAAPRPEAKGLTPGFADPVLDAQRTFRALLDAFSRPGRIQRLALAPAAPAPLGTALTATALTLADADTPLWLAPAYDTPAVRQYLAFHCGAPFVTDPASAAFGLAPGAELPALGELSQGELRDPDQSATAFVDVTDLADGGGWRLSGPGVRGSHRLTVHGLPADFPVQWAANGARFPQGVDLVLTCGDRLAALPRTTRMEA
jgi:alpha-D-ribose 1-methylphosphonate 5-triphosphate synthase subunit PhnH